MVDDSSLQRNPPEPVHKVYSSKKPINPRSFLFRCLFPTTLELYPTTLLFNFLFSGLTPGSTPLQKLCSRTPGLAIGEDPMEERVHGVKWGGSLPDHRQAPMVTHNSYEKLLFYNQGSNRKTVVEIMSQIGAQVPLRDKPARSLYHPTIASQADSFRLQWLQATGKDL